MAALMDAGYRIQNADISTGLEAAPEFPGQDLTLM